MVIFFYYFIINILAFLFIWNDKKRAIRGKWRIKERTLWGIALLGGAFFMLLSMYLFRHKTKHLSFRYGMPIVLLLHILILLKLT